MLFAAYLLRLCCIAFVGEAGGAGDNEEVRESGALTPQLIIPPGVDGCQIAQNETVGVRVSPERQG